MTVTPETLTNSALAENLNCSVRTIQRMRRKGVEFSNPESVADYVLGLKNPSLGMLVAASRNLAAMPKPSGNNAFIDGWRKGWQTPSNSNP